MRHALEKVRNSVSLHLALPRSDMLLLRLCSVCWSSCALWCASLETVLELAWDELERSHASSAGGLSPLCLLTPVVYPSVSMTDLACCS